MLWAAACLCFCGFLRSGEATCPSETEFDPESHLAFSDVAVDSRDTPTALQVTIKASKTDPSAGSHPPHRCVRGASVPSGCSTELRGGEGEFSRSLVPLGGWQVPDTGPVCGEYANCPHSGRIQGQGLCGPQFSHWCGYHGGPAGYTRFADQDSWPLGEQRLYPLH